MRLLVVVLVLLASWGLLAAAGLSLGEADARELATGPAGAVLSVALLVADVLVPVPSTVVMVAQGAAFGALGGAALAWLGMVGAAATAYGAGRIAARRGAAGPGRGASEERRAPRASLAAIAISRPVPILAEALMAVAGADRVPARAALGAAAAGALPVALVFATLGAAAGGPVETALVAGATLALTALLWSARRRGRPARR